ncbi:MAG: ATP-grasp domain-containing protein [Gaiellaceae bacterium]|jgi:RimK family alpha-L-glutamate ligase
MAFAIIAHSPNQTNLALASAWRAGECLGVIAPHEALDLLGGGDAALARLDVRPGLDGVEPGLSDLVELERRGVRVLNRPEALLAGHDKLLTARLLESGSVPTPRTTLVGDDWNELASSLPLVIKPRFGSWGTDVFRVENDGELRKLALAIAGRPWLQRGGAIAQELVPPIGFDLRVLVAFKRVVGAVRRRAVDGEWRTNIACGATRMAETLEPQAARLALEAVEMTRLDLACVDILPLPGGGFCALEVNAAPDFSLEYNVEEDVFGAVTSRLELAAATRSYLEVLDAA